MLRFNDPNSFSKTKNAEKLSLSLHSPTFLKNNNNNDNNKTMRKQTNLNALRQEA